MQELIPVAIGAAIALFITSIYNLAAVAIKKRVTIRSPESQAIEQLVPAVNALLDMQGPQMRAHIATLEALQGQCNGNVTDALAITRAAHAKYNAFLTDSARVQV